MANFYFLNTGDADWNTGSNWSDTDGGTTINTVPPGTISDFIFFTALSGNCSLNTIAPVANIDFTGYTKTLTIGVNGILNCTQNGTVIFNNIMKIMGSGSVRLGYTNIRTNGLYIPFITVTGTNTLTLLDILNAEIMQIQPPGATPIWTGSFGWVVKSYISLTTNGATTTLTAGNIYRAGSFKHISEKGSAHGKVVSSTPGTKAILTVTGDTNIGYVDFTDIDASGGRTLYPFNGVITNCNNIVSMTDKFWINKTVASSSII